MSKLHLNFIAKSFIFGHKSGNVPRTFSVNLESGELWKYMWTSPQTSLFLDTQILKMRPELFCKPCKWKISKMHLNCTANLFVFARINRESVSRTIIVNLARWKLPNASELHSKYFRRFWTHKSWKWAQTFFPPWKQSISKTRLNIFWTWTVKIMKICPAHLWKNNEMVLCEIFFCEGNCIQFCKCWF